MRTPGKQSENKQPGSQEHEEATEGVTGEAAGVAEATHTPLNSSSSSSSNRATQADGVHATRGTWTREVVPTATAAIIIHACTAGTLRIGDRSAKTGAA